MKTSTLFKKTMPFVWAKLLLGAVTIVASIILLVIFLLIAAATDSSGLLAVFFVIWIAATKTMTFFSISISVI